MSECECVCVEEKIAIGRNLLDEWENRQELFLSVLVFIGGV